MSDWQIVDAIEHKGHFAHLILPASLSSYDKSIVDGIERYGVQVRYVSSPYIHAKAIAGNSMCFIGSENFTATSLNHNREVGLSFSGAICAKLRADIKEL
jgi:phosphatidylserine/phosphatidylglycerophosphate/cardiolipin synthase-like enzyme